MKKASISTKDAILLAVLFILLVAVGYYMGFYKPLQADLQDLSNQSATADSAISTASTKLASMDKMQAEVDEVLSRPKDKITEIAPYDNSKVVMNELNNILSNSLKYNLSFEEPKIEKNGTVRRTVNMSFTSAGYADAKAIVEQLAGNHWRCMVSNLSMSAGENVRDGEVNVSASIVFFESTNIA